MLIFLVPAAGSGKRMGANQAKQFLPFGKSDVLGATVQRLLHFVMHEAQGAGRVVVALPEAELSNCAKRPVWQNALNSGQLRLCAGREERHLSVLAAWHAATPAADDLLLVHDAARPLIRAEDIARLCAAAAQHADGAVLVKPCRNALKKIKHGKIIAALDRSSCAEALTPQAFRAELLERALRFAVEHDLHPADESEAVAYVGCTPLAVTGHADNIKITFAEDLAQLEAAYQRVFAQEES